LILVRIPARIPVAGDCKAEAGWMYFLSHNLLSVVRVALRN
jgi:hypothetical protein